MLDEVRQIKSDLSSIQEAAPQYLTQASPHTKVVVIQVMVAMMNRLEELENKIVESEAKMNHSYEQIKELQVRVSYNSLLALCVPFFKICTVSFKRCII